MCGTCSFVSALWEVHFMGFGFLLLSFYSHSQKGFILPEFHSLKFSLISLSYKQRFISVYQSLLVITFSSTKKSKDCRSAESSYRR